MDREYSNLVRAQFFDSQSVEEDINGQGAEEVIQKTPPNLNDGEPLEELLKETSSDIEIKSNIWEVLRECRPDAFLLSMAVIGSAIQGCNFPILSQIIVQTYKVVNFIIVFKLKIEFKAYAMDGENILTYGHFWAAMFLVLGVIRPITLYCQFFFFGKVSEKLSTRLRIKSFQHLLSLPCAFYDDPKHSPTRLVNRLNTDPSNIKAAVDARLGSLLMSMVSFSLAILIACYYSWKLTLQASIFKMFHIS